jgi:hypothetical protein
MKTRTVSLILCAIVPLLFWVSPLHCVNSPHESLTGTWAAVQNGSEFFVVSFDWKGHIYSGKVFDSEFTKPLRLVEEHDNIVIFTTTGEKNMKVEIIDGNHILMVDGLTKVAMERKLKAIPKAGIPTDIDPAVKSAIEKLPPYDTALVGANEVSIRNPNHFDVAVALRSEARGKDFSVAANGSASVFVPNGKYEIYFVYSTKPNALFKGDDFALNNNSVEIQIVEVAGGNYGIKQVK